MYRGKENAETANWLEKNVMPCIIICYGRSLSPFIKSAQPVVVEPITEQSVIGKDDIIFCRLKSDYRLRKVIYVEKNQHYKVGTARGFISGAVNRKNIFGIVVRVLK